MAADMNIYTLQQTLNEIIDDIETACKKVVEKYSGKLPQIPELSELKKVSTFHKVFNDCMKAAEELVDVMTKADMVILQLEDIKNTKLTRDLSNDIRELSAFKNRVENKVTSLKTLRYDIMELKRLCNDKVKYLQGLMYRES